MKLRAACHADISQLHALYEMLSVDAAIGGAQQIARVLDHPGTHILVACVDARVFAMITVHILPNVTWSGRPYALIENVVTHKNERGQGYGRALLQHAIDTCEHAGVYKIMLLTGRHRSARGFYEKLGFSKDEKWGMTKRFS
ncbi:MAG: GNAT family N-acetyltransferase [Pseudomonadota bacterium]